MDVLQSSHFMLTSYVGIVFAVSFVFLCLQFAKDSKSLAYTTLILCFSSISLLLPSLFFKPRNSDYAVEFLIPEFIVLILIQFCVILARLRLYLWESILLVVGACGILTLGFIPLVESVTAVAILQRSAAASPNCVCEVDKTANNNASYVVWFGEITDEQVELIKRAKPIYGVRFASYGVKQRQINALRDSGIVVDVDRDVIAER